MRTGLRWAWFTAILGVSSFLKASAAESCSKISQQLFNQIEKQTERGSVLNPFERSLWNLSLNHRSQEVFGFEFNYENGLKKRFPSFESAGSEKSVQSPLTQFVGDSTQVSGGLLTERWYAALEQQEREAPHPLFTIRFFHTHPSMIVGGALKLYSPSKFSPEDISSALAMRRALDQRPLLREAIFTVTLIYPRYGLFKQQPRTASFHLDQGGQVVPILR